MESSILFNPEVNERALNREVKQIDQSLDQAGEITPQFDDGALGDLGGGGGGGRPGGLGTGGAVGAGALASRIPKPISGVTAASALPVALAGGIGVGLLSAMHGASARLQTSTSLLGQAWNNVWRPIGDRVDELFVRDAVMDVVRATQDFEETWRSGNEMGAMVGLLEDIETGLAGTLGVEIQGAVDIAGLDIEVGGEVTNFLSNVDWATVLTTGPAGLGQQLGEAAGESVANWASNKLPDISSTEVIGAIAWPALTTSGVIGAIAWPTISAEMLIRAMTGGTIGVGDGGKGDGGENGGNGSGAPPGGGVPGPHGGRAPDRNMTQTAGVGGGAPGPRGGRGPNRGMISDGKNIEKKLDEVNRNLKRFARESQNLSLQVDGQQFGQLTTDTRHDSVFDTDPLV